MIRHAAPKDLPDVLALLEQAALPTDDVAEHFDTFFVVDDGSRIVACAGIELHEYAALVRSLAVAADRRGTGIGSAILDYVLHEVRDCAAGVYALTTTAEAYLTRFGFEPVTRDSLPQALFESRELQDTCPASAVVMKWRPR